MAEGKNKLSWVGLRQAISKETGCNSKEAAKFLNSMVTILTETIQKGESVRINGLGTFHTQAMAARKSVNVKTGESIILPAYNKLAFDAESSLVENMNMRSIITPSNDPMQKLSEQADEILGILADMGQGPKGDDIKEQANTMIDAAEVSTPATSVPDNTPMEQFTDELPVEETAIPSMVQKPVDINIPGSDILPNEGINPLQVVDVKSPQRNKPPFHPWRVAGITIIVFCMLLIGGYIFLEHQIEMWIYHIQDNLSNNSEQVVSNTIDNTPQNTPYDTIATADTLDITYDDTTIVKHEVPEEIVEASTSPYNEFIATETLRKNDRLVNLARKYYGDKNLWVFIYDANKDHLPSNPNNIAPGAMIRIPKLSDQLLDSSNPDTQRQIKELEQQFLH